MDKPAPKHNSFVMQFGQIIAHDTELTMPKSLSECYNIFQHNCINYTVESFKKLEKTCE